MTLIVDFLLLVQFGLVDISRKELYIVCDQYFFNIMPLHLQMISSMVILALPNTQLMSL